MPMAVTKTSSENLPLRELWSLMDRTGFAIARLRELELNKYSLTIEQSSILHVLTNNGGSLTIKEIENITMRQHHSVYALVTE